MGVKDYFGAFSRPINGEEIQKIKYIYSITTISNCRTQPSGNGVGLYIIRLSQYFHLSSNLLTRHCGSHYGPAIHQKGLDIT
jgi:hypothetical protein